MKNEKMTSVQCPKCERYFVPRTLPAKRCAKCGFTITRKERSKNCIRSKYFFHEMQIGEMINIPWEINERGFPDSKKSRRINNALMQYKRRSGKKFTRSADVHGLKITRLS